MEDSLKPITFIEQNLDMIGTNMWTTHIIDGLKKSLMQVAEKKKKHQQNPLVSFKLINSLEKQIAEIEAQIGEITKQKGTLYKQVKALKVIGYIEANIELLREYRNKKRKK